MPSFVGAGMFIMLRVGKVVDVGLHTNVAFTDKFSSLVRTGRTEVLKQEEWGRDRNCPKSMQVVSTALCLTNTLYDYRDGK